MIKVTVPISKTRHKELIKAFTEYNEGPAYLCKEAGVSLTQMREALFSDAKMDAAISKLIQDFVSARWDSVLMMASAESRKGVTHYAETCRLLLKEAFEVHKAGAERDRAIRLLEEQGYQVSRRWVPRITT